MRESLDNNEMFLQLQEHYFGSVDEKERLNLRNALFEQLAPLLEHCVAQYSQSPNGFDFDMFQVLTERTLNIIIPRWKPTKYSTDGYYRKSFLNGCFNYTRDEKKRRDTESLTDPMDSFAWEFAGKDDPEVLFENSFHFRDKMVQDAYMDCLEAIKSERWTENKVVILKELWNKYPLSRKKIETVFEHALITFRESYEHYVSDCEQCVCEETLFGRLCKHLDKDTVNKVIKVFGGCTITIPEWKGE